MGTRLQRLRQARRRRRARRRDDHLAFLELVEPDDVSAPGDVQAHAGLAALKTGDHRRAVAHTEQTDAPGAPVIRGASLFQLGRYDEADEVLARAAEDAPSAYLRSQAMRMRAQVASERGDFGLGRLLVQQARAEDDGVFARAACLRIEGDLLHRQGWLDEACEKLEESAAWYHALATSAGHVGCFVDLGYALVTLVHVARQQGESERAMALAVAAIEALSVRPDNRFGMGIGGLALADALVDEGHLDDAVEVLREAAEFVEQVDSVALRAELDVARGNHARAAGDPSTAESCYQAAREAFAGIGNAPDVLRVEQALAACGRDHASDA